MKGTEVPNPRRRSACDCTCVLTRNWSLSRDTLMLAMYILFCSCPCKVRSRVSDALSQTLCNLSLAFLADFTLSRFWYYCSHTFHSFLSQITLCFSERHDHSIHMSSVLQVQQLHCGHTFVGGILTVLLPMTNNRTRKERLSQVRTKGPLSMWSRLIRMRIFSGVKNGWLVT